MASHNDLGKKGELLALRHLEERLYQILETNYRNGKGEIDIIAKDKKTLVFVEVKTRSSEKFGAPEESIDEQKKRLLANTASVYMEKIKHEWEIRFDIISIIFDGNHQAKIYHYKDAFFPGLA